MPADHDPDDVVDLDSILVAADVHRSSNAYSIAAGLAGLATYYLDAYPGPLLDEVDAIAARTWLVCETPLRTIRPRPGVGMGRVSNLRAVIVATSVEKRRRVHRDAIRQDVDVPGAVAA